MSLKAITSFRDSLSACGVAREGKDGHQVKRRIPNETLWLGLA